MHFLIFLVIATISSLLIIPEARAQRQFKDCTTTGDSINLRQTRDGDTLTFNVVGKPGARCQFGSPLGPGTQVTISNIESTNFAISNRNDELYMGGPQRINRTYMSPKSKSPVKETVRWKQCALLNGQSSCRNVIVNINLSASGADEYAQQCRVERPFTIAGGKESTVFLLGGRGVPCPVCMHLKGTWEKTTWQATVFNSEAPMHGKHEWGSWQSRNCFVYRPHKWLADSSTTDGYKIRVCPDNKDWRAADCAVLNVRYRVK